jgi:hypothetical protein
MSLNPQPLPSYALSLTSLVWFQLLDSVTGLPYKGTSADFVSPAPGSVIAQFRDAVHLKNSSILTGLSSSQLLVYKNKAAFDKRNAAVKDGKEESLEEDSFINGLGASKKEALVVVVKTVAISISSRQVTTRKMSVEASCRGYLDALAFKLSTYYVFKRKSKLGSTFGDVLEAIEIGKKDKEPRWNYIFETHSYEQQDENGSMIEINAGDPIFPTY